MPNFYIPDAPFDISRLTRVNSRLCFDQMMNAQCYDLYYKWKKEGSIGVYKKEK